MTQAEVQTLLTETGCVECLSSKTLLAVIVNLLITYTGGTPSPTDGDTIITEEGDTLVDENGNPIVPE